MIIDDPDLVRIAVTPAKADSPLIVDTDTVKVTMIARHFFKPIPRGYKKIVQRLRGIDDDKLTEGNPLDVSGNPSGAFPLE